MIVHPLCGAALSILRFQQYNCGIASFDGFWKKTLKNVMMWFPHLFVGTKLQI